PIAVLRRRGRLGLGYALPQLRRNMDRGERAHDVLLEPQPALELAHHVVAAVPHDHRVDAVTALADLVSEATLAPLLHLDHLAAQVLEPPRHAVGAFLGFHLVVARIEDVARLVLGHASDSSSRTRRLNWFMATSAPSATQHSTASAARR